MGKWFSYKIFTKGAYTVPDAMLRVWALRDPLLPILESTLNKGSSFFLHYSHPREYPEGPHFKFHFHANRRRRRELKKLEGTIAQDPKTERVELHKEKRDRTKREGLLAREVFNDVKLIGKTNPSALKAALRSNNKYLSLSDDVGRHYVHNMLQMSGQEEYDFFVFFNQ